MHAPDPKVVWAMRQPKLSLYDFANLPKHLIAHACEIIGDLVQFDEDKLPNGRELEKIAVRVAMDHPDEIDLRCVLECQAGCDCEMDEDEREVNGFLVEFLNYALWEAGRRPQIRLITP